MEVAVLDIKKPMRVVDLVHQDSLYRITNVIFANDELLFCEVAPHDWVPGMDNLLWYMTFDRKSNISFVNPRVSLDRASDSSFSRHYLENYEPSPGPNLSLSQRAREFARSAHLRVGQTYDDKPYIFHVDMAADVAHKFKHLIPENAFEIALAGIYLHDTPEDVHFITYNPLKKEFGKQVADIAFALENEKGKFRPDRANDKYYREMKEVPYAVFAKLCDRIANMTHGLSQSSSMREKYREEYPDFKKKTYDDRYQEMYEYIETELL